MRIRKDLSMIVWFGFAIGMFIHLIFFRFLNTPDWIFNIIQLIIGILCWIMISYNIIMDNGGLYKKKKKMIK